MLAEFLRSWVLFSSGEISFVSQPISSLSQIHVGEKSNYISKDYNFKILLAWLSKEDIITKQYLPNLAEWREDCKLSDLALLTSHLLTQEIIEITSRG